MRVGYIQLTPELGDLAENRRRVEAQVGAAPEADLWVLPELCNSGYNFVSREQAESLAEGIDGPFVETLQKLSARRSTHLVAGFCERAAHPDGTGTVLYNSAVLVRPDGSTELYRKLHLFWNEKTFFAPGDLGLPVFKVGEANVGMLICFDWQFPEAWRVLALRGADVVCHPSNLVLPGLAQRSIPVHAMLNRLHVVTANRIGSERDLTFTGRSVLVSARGDVLSEAPADREAIDYREIDLAQSRDKGITPRNDLLGDRRPSFYADLLDSPKN